MGKSPSPQSFEMKVNVREGSGTTHEVETTADTAVSEFKGKVQEVTGIPVDRQRLIFKGRILKDADLLSKYGIEEGHTLHAIRGAAPPGSAPPAPAPTPAAAAPAAPAPAPGAGGPNPLAGLMGSMGGMGGMGGGQQGGGGSFAQMQQQMMQQLQQNPEMMQEIMDSPMMRNMMENPEVLRGMMQNNPQMQALMRENPEMRAVMNDPEMLRNAMRMATNPSLRQEMMRNTDRAMAQIENIPGGVDALRRMQEQVGDPMLDAFSAQSQSSTATGPLPTAPSQPTSSAMPNPWARGGGGASPGPAAAPAPGASTGTSQDGPAASNPFAAFGGMPGMGAGGGMGAMPGMGGMGGMGDPDTLLAMLDNPMFRQSLQQIASNPEQARAAFQSNPMLQSMLQSNPQLQALLENPAMLQMMINPDYMRSMLQMQSQMRSRVGGGSPGSMGGSQQPAGGGITADMLSQQLNAFMGSQGSSAPAPAPTPAPVATSATPAASGGGDSGEYAAQLSQLENMGFDDRESNLRALRAAGGNVQDAVERLLSGL